MKIEFTKMHGAGNDFIMIDDRDRKFPDDDSDIIAAMATRHTGVGCDGVILVQPSEQADFRMRFFNPDGGEVEMCGNGARCVARFARDIGAAGDRMAFDTVAGRLAAEIVEDQVRLQMTAPKDWRMNQRLSLSDGEIEYHFVNSGVAHVVVEVEDLENVDVQKIGAEIRYHDDFKPAGTNANFISVTGADSLRLRTYERGVEGETLACGTGMTAAALIAGKLGRVESPVKVACAFGDVLTIGYNLTDSGAESVTLAGAAKYVFSGRLEI